MSSYYNLFKLYIYFSVLEIELSVVLADLSYDPAGITVGYNA